MQRNRSYHGKSAVVKTKKTEFQRITRFKPNLHMNGVADDPDDGCKAKNHRRSTEKKLQETRSYSPRSRSYRRGRKRAKQVEGRVGVPNIEWSPKDPKGKTNKRRRLDFHELVKADYRARHKTKRRVSISELISMTQGKLLQFMEPAVAAFLLEDIGTFSGNGPEWQYLLQHIMFRGRAIIPRPFRMGKASAAGGAGQQVKIARMSIRDRVKEHILRINHEWTSFHPGLLRMFFPILCAWLVELHFELFGSDARMWNTPLGIVHTAMRYLFFFLSKKRLVTSKRLQLVGVSCYRIALDQEFGRANTLKLGLDDKRYAYYTDNAYTADEVGQMCLDIRDTLPHHSICRPSVLKELLHVLGLYSDTIVVLFANYAVDLAMHHSKFYEVMASDVAAAAILFAHKEAKGRAIDKASERRILHFIWRKSIDELEPTVKALRKLYCTATSYETGAQQHCSIKAWLVIKYYRGKFIELSSQQQSSRRCRKSLFR